MPKRSTIGGSEGFALADASVFAASAGNRSDRIVLAPAAMCGPLLGGVAARASEGVVAEIRRVVRVRLFLWFVCLCLGRHRLEVLWRDVLRRIAAGVRTDCG
jgi:hypothetical protein